MAGILDFLQTPEAQMGIGLLAAGGPSTTPMNVGQRVQMAMQGMNAQQQNALKMKLLQSQVDENASQNALRQSQLQRQQRQDAYFLGGGGAAATSSAGAGASAIPGAPSAGAAAGAGAALKAAVGKPADAPNPPQGKFAEWSKQYNIPVDALITDYFSNGGKGIADMIYKRGAPDMQVANGYAYDKNKVGPGFMPSFTTTPDGKSVISRIGPDGLPVVSVPQGAMETFSGYQGIQDRSRAANTPGRPTILPGGRMGGQSQLDEIGGGPAAPQAGTLGERNNNPGNLRPVGASTGFQQFQTPEAGLSAIDQNLQAYGKRGINTIEGVISRWAPSSENNTAAYVASVAKRLGIDPKQPISLSNPYVRQALGTAIMLHENGTGILTRDGGAPSNPGVVSSNPGVQGGGLEFSPAEQAQNEATKARLVDTAKADVVRDTGKTAEGKRAAQVSQISNLAAQLLDQGPTASGVGSLVDTAANFVGQPLKSGTKAQQLEALSGWLVSNVPRMEGPQSNADVLNYQTMAGRVGDRTLPVEARKAALGTLMELQRKYSEVGSEATAPNPAKPAKVLDTLPTANASNKGQRIRDTTTGKVLVSNGLQWKEE